MIEINANYMGVRDLLETVAIPQCQLQMMGVDVAIPFLVGKPGCGKTALMYEICKERNMNLFHCHFALKPIEDLSGLPTEHKFDSDAARYMNLPEETMGTNWTVPDLLTAIYDLAKNGKETIIFLDDIHRCSEAHFDLGYEMFTERTLRGFPLPPKTAFILAGNDSAKAGSKTINSAIINRCSVYKVEMIFDDWKKFAISNGINSKVVSFLSNSANSKFFHEAEQVSRPWASPRSWTRLSNVVSPMESMRKLDMQMCQYLAGSHIGDEAAAKFSAYYNLFAEVDAEAIFRKNSKYNVPEDLGKLYVFCMATCYEYFNGVSKHYDQNVNFNMDKYADKFAEVLIAVALVSKELALVTIKDVIMTSKLFTRSVKPTISLKRAMEKINPQLVESIFDLVTD